MSVSNVVVMVSGVRVAEASLHISWIYSVGLTVVYLIGINGIIKYLSVMDA